MRQTAITIFAVFIAAFRFMRRRRPVSEISAREIIETRLADISRRVRQDGDPDGSRVRDAQSAWARDQEWITSESVITAVQGVRTTITHAGAAEARAVLDELQRQAEANPEGVNGPVVAAARVRFDEMMRRNLQ